MRSKVEFEFLEFARRKDTPGAATPSKNQGVAEPLTPLSSERSGGNSKPHARRVSDGRAVLPMVGIRNGLIAGACIWLAILTILAGMAS
jgi:hypothetical protein